jgi:hypothetical protein
VVVVAVGSVASGAAVVVVVVVVVVVRLASSGAPPQLAVTTARADTSSSPGTRCEARLRVVGIGDQASWPKKEFRFCTQVSVTNPSIRKVRRGGTGPRGAGGRVTVPSQPVHQGPAQSMS